MVYFNAMHTIMLQDIIRGKSAGYATNLHNALSYVLCYKHLKKIKHVCGYVKCSKTIT